MVTVTINHFSHRASVRSGDAGATYDRLRDGPCRWRTTGRCDVDRHLQQEVDRRRVQGLRPGHRRAEPPIVRITATNDIGLSVTETRAVFTGPAFEIAPPAILIDLISPAKTDLNDPRIAMLMSQIQRRNSLSPG